MDNDQLYFVIFEDGGMYATGDQTARDGTTVPGGIIAYVRKDDADRMANSVIPAALVSSMAQLEAIDLCLRRACTLWIKKAAGGMMYIPATAENATRTSLNEKFSANVPITGPTRQRLIEAA